MLNGDVADGNEVEQQGNLPAQDVPAVAPRVNAGTYYVNNWYVGGNVVFRHVCVVGENR